MFRKRLFERKESVYDYDPIFTDDETRRTYYNKIKKLNRLDDNNYKTKVVLGATILIVYIMLVFSFLLKENDNCIVITLNKEFDNEQLRHNIIKSIVTTFKVNAQDQDTTFILDNSVKFDNVYEWAEERGYTTTVHVETTLYCNNQFFQDWTINNINKKNMYNYYTTLLNSTPNKKTKIKNGHVRSNTQKYDNTCVEKDGYCTQRKTCILRRYDRRLCGKNHMFGCCN